jgi:hypothetical protein
VSARRPSSVALSAALALGRLALQLSRTGRQFRGPRASQRAASASRVCHGAPVRVWHRAVRGRQDFGLLVPVASCWRSVLAELASRSSFLFAFAAEPSSREPFRAFSRLPPAARMTPAFHPLRQALYQHPPRNPSPIGLHNSASRHSLFFVFSIAVPSPLPLVQSR